MDSFRFENRTNRIRYVLIFARDKSSIPLNHSGLCTESAIHLRKLQTDIAAANDDQMLRNKIDLHHSGIREDGGSLDSGERGNIGASADVDEDLVSTQSVGVYANRL